MTEAVVVGIVSVLVVVCLAGAGAIWRLGAANAEKANQIATLKAELVELKADATARLARVEAMFEHRTTALGTGLAVQIDQLKREGEKAALAGEVRRTEDVARWLSFTEKLATITGLLSAHPQTHR